MIKKDFYDFVKCQVKPKEIASFYLGKEYTITGDSLVYYSPMRAKERTPSFFVNDEIGLHDFGTGKHYNIISFVADLFGMSYWEATKKIIKDLQLDINEIKKENVGNITQYKEQKNKVKIERGNEPAKIFCYFDERCFNSKPKDKEVFAGIKNRIVNNRFYIYNDLTDLKMEFLKGKTCIPSAIRGNVSKNWKMQQVFLIDFDNKKNGMDITVDNPEHVSERDVICYCKENNITPTFVYNTFSHTEKQHKFRLVYVFEEPITDIEVAKQIPTILINKLKQFNPDESKKNLSDMFFGGIEYVFSSSHFYRVEKK